MARTKDESLHEQRRLQILEAAAEIFKAKGFHAARTEEICATAGLSAGTVFRYFRSKEEIIAAIAEMEIEGHREEIKQLATREGLTWMARLDAQSLAELLAPSQFDLGADSWLELCRNPKHRDRMIEHDCNLRKSLATALRNGQKAGWVRPDLNVSGAANVIMALFSGLMFDRQTNPKIDLAATAEAVASLFRSYILKK
ncbi:MAG: helix-turn-helix domain-containing protein [Candidatus Manganitrophaceae bacterium]